MKGLCVFPKKRIIFKIVCCVWSCSSNIVLYFKLFKHFIFQFRCHTKRALRQAVIGAHEYSSNHELCIINITDENWNHTHFVPIRAAIDLKLDGNITTNFTVKLRVDRSVQFNHKTLVGVFRYIHFQVNTQLCLVLYVPLT